MLAFSETVYDTIKFVHIFAAMVWVGTGLYFQWKATRLVRSGADGQRMALLTGDIEDAGKKLLMPASITVLVMGLVLVWYTPSIGLTDTWILIGLAGAVATTITGAAFLGPTAGKLSTAIEAEGPDTPSVTAMRRKILTVARVDQVVLLIVIVDMVFKPGA
jgi:uncharacterized membrane protein